MRLKIRLGLDLDGESSWRTADALGAATLGPLGLLTLLETQLGLLALPPSPAERIARYRAGLAACDRPERFYHRSFEADPLGTAATLLRWRDDWHLHGWARDFDAGSPTRLLDLQQVEDRLAGALAPSVGERLAVIASKLDERRAPIGEVLLVDPLVDFPARWRAVLARLPVVECPVAVGHGAPGTLLADLQQVLARMAAGDRPEPIAFRDDASLVVVRAETRLFAAHWLAAQPHAGETLLVASDACALLDRVFVARARASQGFSEASGFRPALQLLPLALQLLWAPLDFHALLQFLTHPVCPLPGFVRQRLARELAERPGIGGRGWRRALAAIDDHPEAGTRDVRALIEQWLEAPRHASAGGMPIEAARSRVALVRDWFRRRLGVDEPRHRLAHRAGHEQCVAVATALEVLAEQGVTRLSREQLHKLLSQSTSGGDDDGGIAAETGCLLAARSPGAAIERHARVIWWQPVVPALPQAWPWSRAELAALAAAGVQLPDTATRLAREARAWCRPVLAAEGTLTLVLPPRGEEAHPLWLMIESLVGNLPVGPLEELLTHPESAAGPGAVPAPVHAPEPVSVRAPAMVPVPVVPLPARKRWWRLPADVVIAVPARASFSSLEQLIHNPCAWLLQYPAALRASDILRVAAGSRLCGNLAHALVERWVRTGGPLAGDEYRALRWFDANFDALIDEEGAVLRLPGRHGELAEFRLAARQALRRLQILLRGAQATTLQAEQPLAGSFDGGELIGAADLVVTREDGRSAVIDMKWTARSAVFREKLAKGRQLQLAIYAELLRQMSGHQPGVAYFLMRDASLHAPDALFFPQASIASGPDAEPTDSVWRRLVVTWQWRQAQFARGVFEVVLEGLDPTAESQPPEAGLEIETLYEGFNETLALAGGLE